MMWWVATFTDEFSRGQNADRSRAKYPLTLAIASDGQALCFTIFHTNARSKWLVMSRVTRGEARWDTDKLFITYITAVFWVYDDWVTLDLGDKRSRWLHVVVKSGTKSRCQQCDNASLKGKVKPACCHFSTCNDDWIAQTVKVSGCWLQCLRTYN